MIRCITLAMILFIESIIRMKSPLASCTRLRKILCFRFRTMKLCTEKDLWRDGCLEMNGKNLPISGCCLAYMFTHPGTKLLFMGGEFGQTAEWNHEGSLDWHLLEYGVHKACKRWSAILIIFTGANLPCIKHQFEHNGFEWIDYSDHENSVIAYQRNGDKKEDLLIVVCNFTPEARRHYRVGVPYRGKWKEVFNSDDVKYAGSGVFNDGLLMTSPVKYHGRDYLHFINFTTARNFYSEVGKRSK